MKLFYRCAALLLFLALLASPCLAADLPAPGGLGPSEATRVFNERKNDLVILDVRTKGEFDAGHAEGALHIPVDELADRVQEVPEDAPVLILCRSGRRAAAAFNILARSGRSMENVWFLKGYTDYASGTPTFHK